MINKAILAKLSDEALRELITAATDELNGRLDFNVYVGKPCYAIVKGERMDFILLEKRRTKGSVSCLKTGKLYTIHLSMLKSDGVRKEKPITKEEIAARTGKPKSGTALGW